MSNIIYDASQVLTTQEASEYLKISTQTLRKLREQQIIRSKQVGRQWRYLREDLDRFLRSEDDSVL